MEDEKNDREDAAGADQHESGEAVVVATASPTRKARIGEGALFCGAGGTSSTKVDGRRLGRVLEPGLFVGAHAS